MVSMMADDELEDAVARLRRSYYSSADSDRGDPAVYNHASSLHAQRADLLGMHASLPVVYSSFPVLPQSQAVLDVWQRPDAFSTAIESYINLFEALLRTSEPWYYAHATTLEAGRARGTGTLMRIVNTKRTSDGRLQVLAQGVGRVRILNETQSQPYPRVDAQLLVDAEALLREEAAVREAVASADQSRDLRGPSDGAARDGVARDGTARDGTARDGTAKEPNPVDPLVLQRLGLVSALARERAWWAYEVAGFEDGAGRMPGQLVPFNTSVDLAACQIAADELSARRVAEARAAWSRVGAAVAAADEEYTWDGVGSDWFLEVSEAQAAEAAAEQARCQAVAALERRPEAVATAMHELEEVGLSRVEELEIACWVELDALLRAYAALGALGLDAESTSESALLDAPRVPTELLGLLPPAMPASMGPGARWPEGFELFRMRSLLDGRSEARVDAAYPAWRRATRLSFALACVISHALEDGGLVARRQAEGSPPAAQRLQEMLESVSTADRLRLALVGMRDARRALAA